MGDLAQRLDQLRDQLAVRRQVIEQQQGEISRNRSLVGGPHNIAGADLVVPRGGRLASARLFGPTHAARCVLKRSCKHYSEDPSAQRKAFVERVATADVRALPPMKSGSSLTLNERGVITKNTTCAKHFSEKCEENTCQATGAACVPNGVANLETKLAKFGGDTDTDALRGSRVLYALPGSKAFSAVSRLPASTDLSSVSGYQ